MTKAARKALKKCNKNFKRQPYGRKASFLLGMIVFPLNVSWLDTLIKSSVVFQMLAPGNKSPPPKKSTGQNLATQVTPMQKATGWW